MKKFLTLILIALLVCSCAFVSHAATMTKITPDNEPNPTMVEYKLEIKDNEPAEEKQDLLTFSVNKGGETDIPFHLFLYANKLWFGNEELKSYALEKYDCLQCNSKPVSSGTWIVKFYDGGIDIMTTSNYCQTPNSFNADFSYCAINKFNFGTQASGV